MLRIPSITWSATSFTSYFVFKCNICTSNVYMNLQAMTTVTQFRGCVCIGFSWMLRLHRIWHVFVTILLHFNHFMRSYFHAILSFVSFSFWKRRIQIRIIFNVIKIVVHISLQSFFLFHSWWMQQIDWMQRSVKINQWKVEFKYCEEKKTKFFRENKLKFFFTIMSSIEIESIDYVTFELKTWMVPWFHTDSLLIKM